MFSLFSLVFYYYLLNKSLKHHNQIIYTCIFISKKLQNSPILICIVRFLIGPQDPYSLCKLWDRIWAWMLGQHAGCFITSFYVYIRHSQANLQLGLSDCPAKPIHNWVYQAAGNQANTLLGLLGYSTKPTNSWVYQTIGSQSNIHIEDHPSQLTDGFIRLLIQAITLLGLSDYSSKPSRC